MREVSGGLASDPPRYALATAADATTVLRRLAGAGWVTRQGFTLTDESPGELTVAKLVLFGRVPDLDTARLVVRASARGAGVVAIVNLISDAGRKLVDDLGRLGPVCHDPLCDGEPLPRLLPEQRALLERLANGETIAAAAAAEFLSLRTANRRIALARESLGVRTTREAVLVYLRQRRAR